MFKFVTLYRQVDEPDKLENFFAHTHLALAEQLPGLRHTEVTRVNGRPGGGQSAFYLMYELYFDSEADYRRGFASEPGVALVAAMKPWSDARILLWFYGDAFDEAAGGVASGGV